MSKQYNIKWSNNDVKELERVINNYNRKIYRVKKNKPELADIQPEIVNKTTLMENITTRADYKRVINRLQRYSVRGAEDEAKRKNGKGKGRTIYDEKEAKYIKQRDNRQREKLKREKDILEGTKHGKPKNITVTQMGSPESHNLEPITTDISNLSKWDFKTFKKIMDDRLFDRYYKNRDEIAMRNYMKALINEGFSDNILHLINAVPLKDFMRVIRTEENANFSFIYSQAERLAKEKELFEIWSREANLKFPDKKNNLEKTLYKGYREFRKGKLQFGTLEKLSEDERKQYFLERYNKSVTYEDVIRKFDEDEFLHYLKNTNHINIDALFAELEQKHYGNK